MNEMIFNINKARAKKGIALVTVVMLVAAISVILTGIFFLVNNQLKISKNFEANESALYYAETGLNTYLYHLNNETSFYTTADSAAMLDKDVAISGGFYRLSLLVTPSETDAKMKITATGWPAGEQENSRTVTVELRKRSFAQNVYVTNSETRFDSTLVYWATGDELFGPLHTNGTLLIDGNPIFHGIITYAGGQPQLKSGSHPQYLAGEPIYVDPMVFPTTNIQLKDWAQKDGYYYTGRTSILLQGNQVVIKNQNNAAVTRDLPTNGVIYITGTTDGTKFGLDTGNVFVSGTLNGRLTIGAANDIYITGRDPTNTVSFSGATVTNGVKYDNMVFEGTSASDDMLGLVANKYVRILHNGWFSDTDIQDVAPYNIDIYAAVFAITYSFEYENHSSKQGSTYDKGMINLNGSIIQQYRGAVGLTDGTGYSKSYHQDPRMIFDAPPHFLEPTNTGWRIVFYSEVAAP